MRAHEAQKWGIVEGHGGTSIPLPPLGVCFGLVTEKGEL